MELTVDIAGSGEPLVLVHGLATTRSVWRRVVPLLARTHQVVVLDVPGFGTSAPVGPGFDLDAVADAIGRAVREAGVGEPFQLVGHSMGGAIALTLAARAPQRVRSLVLVSPAGLRPIPALAASGLGALAAAYVPLRRLASPVARMALGRRLLMTGGVVDGAALPADEVRALLAASSGARRTREALAAVAAADLRGTLRDLPMPVGGVWGEGDRVIPPGGATTMRAMRAGAACEVVAGAGHIAMIEQPAAFVEALERVLAAIASR
jgi:pimeloyl-ACP methyl ester carboxylesterase